MMDFDRARNTLYVVGFVAACLMAVYVNYMQKARVSDYMEQESGSSKEYNPKKVSKQLAQMEQEMTAAATALSEHDHEKAAQIFKEQYERRDVRYQYSDEVLPDGQLVKERRDAIFNDYSQAVETEFTWMLEAVAEGLREPDEVRRFAQDHNQLIQGLNKRYNDSRKALEAARARRASLWFRVSINEGSLKWGPSIEKAFTAKWNPDSEKKLVFGQAMGNLERNATWKHVEIRAKLIHAEYNEQGKGWGTSRIPEKLEVVFTDKSKTPTPTSWDSLSKITISVDVPDVIEINSSGTSPEQEKWTKKNLKLLEEKLNAGLSVLQPFELYPGVDLDALSFLSSDGRLNMEAARIFAAKDPGRLRAEFKAVMNTENPALRSDLVQCVISENLEIFLPWLNKTLSNTDERTRNEAMAVLKEQPWFGGYQPMLILLEQGDKNSLHQGVRSLRGQLDNEKIASVLKKKSEEKENPYRDVYSDLYVREIPVDQLPDIGHWVADPDVEFAARTYQQIHTRDNTLGKQLFIDHFAQAPDVLKEQMLRRMQLDNDMARLNEAVAILIEATKGDNETIQREALRRLSVATATPFIWQEVKTLHDASGLGIERLRVWSALVSRAHSAHKDTPEEGMRWIYNQLGLLQKEITDLTGTTDRQKKSELRTLQDIRGAVMRAMFGVEEHWEESLKTLQLFYADNADGDDVAKQVAHAFHGKVGLHTWDHTIPEYKLLMDLLVTHTDKTVRRAVYYNCQNSVKAGQDEFKPLLEAAAQIESDKYLKRDLARILTNLE